MDLPTALVALIAVAVIAYIVTVQRIEKAVDYLCLRLPHRPIIGGNGAPQI